MTKHPDGQLDRVEKMLARLIELVGKQNMTISREFSELRSEINELREEISKLKSEAAHIKKRMVTLREFDAMGEMLGDIHSILTRMTDHQIETQSRLVRLESGK